MRQVKNIFSLILLSFLLQSASAQSSKVISAYNYWQNGDLDKAKDAIDQATENPSSSDNWKTWYYRGKVYLSIAGSDVPEYRALSEDPVTEANNAILKTYKYDSKKMDIKDVDNMYKTIIPFAFNSALTNYQGGNFEKAAYFFEMSLAVNKHFGKTDTTAIYNIALSHDQAGNIAKADEYYRSAIAAGYSPAKTYADLANMYVKKDMLDSALSVYNLGRKSYPRDQNLLTGELNIYLVQKRFDEAKANLDVAIENDPLNEVFLYARGTIFNTKQDYANAEVDYKRAITLKDDYFDAYYNLGAMFFNIGADKINEANDIKDFKEYEKAKAAAEEYFEKAIPYLEKAHTLNETDKNTLLSLKQIYIRKNNTEKFTEINNKLKALD
jgi:tetratricopeptide (TPR) repeat protein